MIGKRLFVVLVLLATLATLALRLPNLGRRPMHLDEAVHAVKFNDLQQTGVYRYDLHEYHGPTLYYCTTPIAWLTGADSFADTTAAMLRLVPLLFGVGLILLLLLAGDGLGRGAAVCASVLAAVSPAMTYYGRYYIQETLLIFFTFAAIVCGWRYVRSRRVGWAILAGVAVGLMHATKETCIIAFGALGLAALLTFWWTRAAARADGRGLSGVDREAGESEGGDASRSSVFRGGTFAIIIAILAASLVSVTLYSGFFTNASGPLDSIRTFATYFDRAGNHGLHDHPWNYYLRMLAYTHHAGGPRWSEGLILALAAVGVFVALTGKGARAEHLPFLRLLAIHTLALTAVYSAIPYKTPWCMLSFLHGMTLLAGAGAATLITWPRRTVFRIAIAIALLIPTAQLLQQSRRASSARFECDARNPYVYAHTVRDAEKLTAWVGRVAAAHPDGDRVLIKVIAPATTYWPLPWYLRRYENVGYWEAPPEDADAPIVITTPELLPELQSRFDRDYQQSIYGVRPDVKLVACIERELYDSWVQTQSSATRE